MTNASSPRSASSIAVDGQNSAKMFHSLCNPIFHIWRSPDFAVAEAARLLCTHFRPAISRGYSHPRLTWSMGAKRWTRQVQSCFVSSTKNSWSIWISKKRMTRKIPIDEFGNQIYVYFFAIIFFVRFSSCVAFQWHQPRQILLATFTASCIKDLNPKKGISNSSSWFPLTWDGSNIFRHHINWVSIMVNSLILSPYQLGPHEFSSEQTVWVCWNRSPQSVFCCPTFWTPNGQKNSSWNIWKMNISGF